MTARKLPIAAITIGPRHRRDIGDVSGLADSIKELGLLHPIVVNPDSRLIAGERRLHACKMLGLTEVPITVVDLDELPVVNSPRTPTAKTSCHLRSTPSGENSNLSRGKRRRSA